MVLDRRVLVDQTSERLNKYNVEHGVAMAGHWRYLPHKLIQICSAQTLEARGSMPDLKLLIIDEAHSTRKSMAEFIKNNPALKVIGLSASPFTKGLGGIYSNVICTTTTGERVDNGDLCKLRVFVAKEIDMRGTFRVHAEVATAVQFLNEGLVNGKPVITGILPMDKAIEAFELACDKSQSLKVQIEFEAA